MPMSLSAPHTAPSTPRITPMPANDDEMRLASMPTTDMFGLPLISEEKRAMAQALVQAARARQRHTVGFINAHCVNVAASNAEYRNSLGQLDHLLPDGSGLRLAGKLAGRTYADNLNGTDLFPLICEEAARQDVTLFLLGGEDGVAKAAAIAMMRRYPGLVITGCQHGYFPKSDTARVIRKINRSEADMVFVGFGVPLQENWLTQHSERIDAPVQLAVGGLFDYYSGRIPRAPAAIRKIGCEWAWRLAQEPRRLASRYLWGNATFVMRALMHGAEARAQISFIDVLKRAGDFAATALGLTVLLPIFAAIALAIKLEDGGPVFYSQMRIGKDGRPFRLFKFRSMMVNADGLRAQIEHQSERDDVCFKMRKDPRITRVGATLRRASLDELPQLLNVLIGEMSLVGPRPALPCEVAAYPQRAMARLKVKPGITCIWQVSGRAEIPFTQQVEMDIDYVEQHGPLRDIALLLQTVPAVVTGRGAY